ncbi:permease-like cell division protein FtsX [Actinoplanes regularis]|uniref:FtsX extracellular domain-containing protein n=1 Tax=Actinoplanes regularis TaxID=52697 RepID=A0A239DWU2_9ACTN|nr:permease-like cell division protein FtsX [Actinoplanes regularis]GIE88996.1 hypothetical protein Are01nite_54760 [Actinoplanes regularis]SNS36172.1 hypothetical protein SAMN06264365_114108 [Actinoplanes regularis]
MQRNLRDHFEAAVSDDPGFALDGMAQAAIVEGSRLRRRHGWLAPVGVAAGLIAVIGAVTAPRLLADAPKSADSPVTVAAAMMPVTAPSCWREPVDRDATDVVIYLTDVTGEQLSLLRELLHGDPGLAALAFESREEAYSKFRTRWATNPDLLAAVTVTDFPAAFRLRLQPGTDFPTVRARYENAAGVDRIVGRRCATDAPVGGVQ